MNKAIQLNGFDLAIFIVYMFLAVGLGFLVSIGRKRTTRGYFLGGKTLPWFVIATSMLASDVSSEHFIANAGIGYKFGIVAATGSWNAWIIYSIFIWIFLPYYVRTNLYTIPQFLERRYSTACRYIFSASLVVGYVAAILPATLYAGGLAAQRMLGPFVQRGYFAAPHHQIVSGIVFFAVLTGAYTIYGGLRSAAWTDFMQIIILGVGGILVPILGLRAVGGFKSLIHEYPEHFQVFLPVYHERFPFTGVFTGFLTVGIWYTCTSQHMVQRVLAAKDEYNARMGVIGAGFLHIVTPFFFVFPGIIAYKLLGPKFAPMDSAYLTLVERLVWPGLRGLILAAMAAALMSNLSAVLNSASTLITIDFYKKLFKPDASDTQQVHFGQIGGAVLLIAAAIIAWQFSLHPEIPLFIKVQNIFFWIAPPFSVIFCAGLLWRRANTIAALVTIALGFAITPVLDALMPGVYLHRAFFSWCFCVIVMLVTSLLTHRWSARHSAAAAVGQLAGTSAPRQGAVLEYASPPPSRHVLSDPPPEEIDAIIWSRRYAELPLEERERYSGIKNWKIWWLIFVGSVLAIYAWFLWFRFQYPIPMFHRPLSS